MQIEGREDYTNRSGLIDVQTYSFGRYAIFSSDNPLPNNNLPETPSKIRPLLLGEILSRMAEYHLILAVDINYLLKDAFYQDVFDYVEQRAHYTYELALLLSGVGLMIISFPLLPFLSERRGRDSREVSLFPSDRHHFESSFLLLSLFCAVVNFLTNQVTVRLLRLTLPSGY